MIVGADHPEYRKRLNNLRLENRYNGAFYYAKEIKANIIPLVETDRNWVLVNAEECADHSIVFIHDNLNPERTYDWLERYNDLVLVCGVPETMERVKHLGKPIYLPLSVDVDYVSQFRVEKKTKGMAFAGRPSKRNGGQFPYICPSLANMPRERLLRAMADYKQIYAVGRTAIEAKILQCEVLPYDPRYPDPSIWQIVDNKEAAEMLQRELDKIDGGKE